jgi:hypothetical protein
MLRSVSSRLLTRTPPTEDVEFVYNGAAGIAACGPERNGQRGQREAREADQLLTVRTASVIVVPLRDGSHWRLRRLTMLRGM